jgi:tetratricopeptide (TPR) repeat protein
MYDELLAAVRARVNRYGNSGDPEDVLHPAGTRDAEALLRAAGELPAGQSGGDGRTPLIDAQHAAGLLYYARHVVLSAGDDETDLDRAEPLLRPVFDHVADLVEQLQALAQVPTRPVRRNPQQVAVFTFAGRPLDEIDTVIAVTRHAVLAAVDDGTDTLPLRMNLAEGHQLRYTRTGDVADLTDAIDITREVLAATPADDPMRGNRLTTLATFLQLRFASTTDRGDLHASIDAYREALAWAADGDEDRPMYLSNLGRAHVTRYAFVSQDSADLEKGLELLRSAVSKTPAGELGRDTRLHVLSQAYRLRYARTGDLADLEAALRAVREALEVTHPEHPERPERMFDLGATHLARYERTGNGADAVVAQDLAKRLMQAAPEDHPLYAAARDLLDRARRR